MRRTITTVGVNSNSSSSTTYVAQVDSILGTTNALSDTNKISWGYDSPANMGEITFGTNQECDSNWIVPPLTSAVPTGVTTMPNRSYGCYGITKPWGFSAMTQYKAASANSPEVKGYVRAWKWLADEGADRTKVWGLEVKDSVNILVYEKVDKVAIANPAGGSPAQVWGPVSYQWFTTRI